jgi:hypothetical protein
MYHLMQNLPVLGTLGMAAMLAGPLARLPIDLGAWLLDTLVSWLCPGIDARRATGRGTVASRRRGRLRTRGSRSSTPSSRDS